MAIPNATVSPFGPALPDVTLTPRTFTDSLIYDLDELHRAVTIVAADAMVAADIPDIAPLQSQLDALQAQVDALVFVSGVDPADILEILNQIAILQSTVINLQFQIDTILASSMDIYAAIPGIGSYRLGDEIMVITATECTVYRLMQIDAVGAKDWMFTDNYTYP
jgi:hypothetical protein